MERLTAIGTNEAAEIAPAASAPKEPAANTCCTDPGRFIEVVEEIRARLREDPIQIFFYELYDGQLRVMVGSGAWWVCLRLTPQDFEELLKRLIHTSNRPLIPAV